MQYRSNWFQLYRRAVLETESYRVNDRVDAASRGIQEQLMHGAIDPRERQDHGTVPALSRDDQARRSEDRLVSCY